MRHPCLHTSLQNLQLHHHQQLLQTHGAPVPVTKQECPTREQVLKNPVGKILEGNKKITGYELVGKECLMVTENLTIPDQIIGNIPNAGMITTTGSIAVVATTSALLAKPVADLSVKVGEANGEEGTEEDCDLTG